MGWLECRLVDCNVAGSGGKSRNAPTQLEQVKSPPTCKENIETVI